MKSTCGQNGIGAGNVLIFLVINLKLKLFTFLKCVSSNVENNIGIVHPPKRIEKYKEK
jgi:hypothetical protein